MGLEETSAEAALSELNLDDTPPTVLPPEYAGDDGGFSSLGSGLASLAAYAAFQTAILFLLAGGGIPIATYLLYMTGYLVLSVVQAIVILPGLLKENRGSDRSETAG
ncbi:MAG: hypothetical protein D6741_09900 [Planctomycetota bacterium]|nr:MAG: hypothetical protein D6741_09900 [Planctomycetota bacterium]